MAVEALHAAEAAMLADRFEPHLRCVLISFKVCAIMDPIRRGSPKNATAGSVVPDWTRARGACERDSIRTILPHRPREPSPAHVRCTDGTPASVIPDRPLKGRSLFPAFLNTVWSVRCRH